MESHQNHVPNHRPDINGIVDLPMKHGDFPWLCKRLPGRVYGKSYSYGHLPVITGYKWDYTFYKWGYKYL